MLKCLWEWLCDVKRDLLDRKPMMVPEYRERLLKLPPIINRKKEENTVDKAS